MLVAASRVRNVYFLLQVDLPLSTSYLLSRAASANRWMQIIANYLRLSNYCEGQRPKNFWRSQTVTAVGIWIPVLLLSKRKND